MKKSTRFLLSFLFCLFWFSLVSAQNTSGSPRGHLLIAGGEDQVRLIMSRFIDMAGKKDKAKILVIPMASETPEATGKDKANKIKGWGVKQVDYLVVNRKEADEDEVVDKLSGYTAIYFSGGSQTLLAKTIVGTKLHKKIQQMYYDGAVIGGTSAGAAIMSKVMLTGGEYLDKKNKEESAVIIKSNNIMLREGLGLLEDVIIDQHFVKLRRQNRLFTLALEKPQLLGVGIDEETAIIVYPDKTMEVIGKSLVFVFDSAHVEKIKTDNFGNISGQGIWVHILSAGDRYDFKTRSILSK